MSVIAITSGKGGVGKSCVAAYTGIALAKQGKKTLLVEMGGGRSVDLITGMQDQVVFDIGDVLSGACEAEKAVLDCGIAENLFLIPGGLQKRRTAETEAEAETTAQLLRTLAAQYDYVLLDNPDFSVLPAAFADLVIMVLTPDSLSIRACQWHANALYEAGARAMRLVINHVPPRILPMYGAKDFDDIIDSVGAQLLGVIPASPKLQYSAGNGQPLDENSLTLHIYDNLAARLTGQRRPLLVK